MSSKEKRSFSIMGAKKKVASKVGETKMGRSTVTKALGPSGEEIIGALKEAVTKYDSKEKAKQLKKDSYKWIMKASLLWKDQQLNRDNAGHLQRPVQMLAERSLYIVDHYKPGDRDPSVLSAEAHTLSKELAELLDHLSKEKNVDKLTNIVDYYFDVKFLTALFNDETYAPELDSITKHLREILLPLPSVFDDQESATRALTRADLCVQVLSPRLALFLGDYPEMVSMFNDFLKRTQSAAASNAYQFLLVVNEYKTLSAKKLRQQRCQNIYNKYVAEHGEKCLHIPVELAQLIDDRSVEGPSNLFDEAFEHARTDLLYIFEDHFLIDQAFLDFQAEKRRELDEMKARFGDAWTANLKK